MFAGYISLAKELQNISNWRQKLQEVMSKIDFSINNPKWESLKTATDLNKRLLKNISNYFKEMI
jgi:6-pyruvoyl-tetrahydropterin synthase